MKFIDELVIDVESGKGGDGMVAFRREKFVPYGGPSGGDGGRGGDVVLVATRDLNTLFELGFQRLYQAEPGENGQPKNMEGANGRPCELRVPVGTLVYRDDTGELLCDLSEPGARFVVARGGRGGRGNARFASSVRRAPRIAEKGEPGERLRLRLELKLLADIGLVGLPNAGKSTLLAAVSNARPKVADYPFTTLVPHLGIIKREGRRAFCMADLPGLIEGAHAGAGLGIQFLKHIERTRLLLHLVDLGTQDRAAARRAFQTIRAELGEYDPALLERPMLVVATKLDLPTARQNWPAFRTWVKKQGFEAMAISAATHEGVDALLDHLAATLDRLPAPPLTVATPEPVIEYLPPFELEKVAPGQWEARGREIERLVAMTDFTNDEAILRFKRNVQKMGFLDELARQAAAPDDTVSIGDMEFQVREFAL
ncbi:MAG: GTP-binding protein Obg [Candidatus Ozemobacter sibiricus]|uniref:GTPase Obg n=1 Tax=Candidatus Ozemobacter sibiricus TaxID=2268124 RepID=A0A367ZPL5_9BACT|nr:MAG: GTP-binding protein Obg [Candidatus Ozemobacter sibiricus]